MSQDKNEEFIEARMLQKHDVEENWKQVPNFIPRNGEFIIYDKDDKINKQRIKIGDGENILEDLNFLTGEIYVQKKKPEGASEGAVWIKIDDEDINTNPEYTISWDRDEGEEGSILERPIWIEGGSDNNFTTISAPSMEKIQDEDIKYIMEQPCYKVFEYISWKDLGLDSDFDGISFQKEEGAENLKIKDCFFDLEIFNNSELEPGIYYINGTILGFSSGYGFFVEKKQNEEDLNYLAFFAESLQLSDSLPSGLYFFLDELSESFKIYQMKIYYHQVKIKEEYKSNFKLAEEARVFILDDFAIKNIALKMTESYNDEFLIKELSRFKSGEILLVPTEFFELLPEV